MNKCLFLDRDGTINAYKKGYNFLPSQVEMIEGADKLVAKFAAAGYLIIIITNQGGIARGLYTEDDMKDVNAYIDGYLRARGGRIDAFYYCPHDDKFGKGKYRVKCDCKKPDSGLIERAVRDFDIDRRRSIFVGDNYTDKLCAEKGGVRFYPFEFRSVVATSHGFRIVIDRYSDELIDKIFVFAENQGV